MRFWLLLAWIVAGLAAADNFPSRPIRLVVPYPPGGGTDTVARPLAQKLSEAMRQPVVVDNRGGASEIIGTEIVAHASADGYTLLMTTNAFAINAALRRTLPYDPERDFAPVSTLVTTPFMLVTPPGLKAESLKELVELARAQPGKLNYASIGAGTPHQLAMEWLKLLSGADIVAVPYKGVGPALAAVMAGEVQTMLTGLSAGLVQVRAGRLRALAVTTATRSAAVPDVPTVAESGYPGYEVLAWYGILAPAATPPDAIVALNRELGKALRSPDLGQRLASIGVEPAPGTSGELAARMRKEIELWARVIREAGIKTE